MGAMTWNRVLIVRVPRPVEDVEKYTEYIRRGLQDGVLILGADVQYSIEKFPPLGAVEVVEDVSKSGTAKTPTERLLPDIPAASGVSRPEPRMEEPPARPPSEAPKPAAPVTITLPRDPKPITRKPPADSDGAPFVGVGAIEKRKIHERLNRYWKNAGPGAMQRLADAVGWQVASVYGAQRGERFDLQRWRELSCGMDRLGFEVEG